MQDMHTRLTMVNDSVIELDTHMTHNNKSFQRPAWSSCSIAPSCKKCQICCCKPMRNLGIYAVLFVAMNISQRVPLDLTDLCNNRCAPVDCLTEPSTQSFVLTSFVAINCAVVPPAKPHPKSV
jgi:hypothetical protein